MEKEVNETGGKLNASQAVGVLIQGVRIGQEKGAYSLEDAAIIMQAIKVFEPNQDTTGEPTELGEDDSETESPK